MTSPPLLSAAQPAFLRLDGNLARFGLLCLIWGTTWIGLKAGIATVPPLLFAGSRFTVAGAILLAWSALTGQLAWPARADWPRLAAASLLLITLCYGPIVWGMLYVNSGTAAVLDLACTPVALLGFALLFGEERFDRRRALSIGLGIVGLTILFGPTALGQGAPGVPAGLQLAGALAVTTGAVTYGWGSVLARPLLQRYPRPVVAGLTTLIGGTVLLAASLLTEPDAPARLDGNWGLAAWSGWLFLVLAGSLIGYTTFMRLLDQWGASRAGLYAFVSPVVAVLLGMMVYGERIGLLDLVGMAVMLAAAGLAL